MLWLFLALLVRFLWACTSAVDQLLARIHKVNTTRATLILQYLTYLPFALLGFLLAGHIEWGRDYYLYCAGAAVGSAFACIPYFIALKHEDAHNVIPYFELTPVFLIILSYIFKNEALTHIQMAGAAIVITSGFLFSWDFEHAHFKFRIFLLLALSSLLFSIYQYCSSQAEAFGGVWGTVAGYYSGIVVVGLVLTALYRDAAQTVWKTFFHTSGRSLALSFASNSLQFLAYCTLLAAFHHAPTLGHVAALSGTQPIFSFLMAAFLGWALPKYYAPMVFDHAAKAKMALVIAIFAGVYLLAKP